ncbi:MAG: glycosyltransferase family 4 protein, partial [Spirosomaceae bacterium]|nr:glycosyltransferase family 4 protein [Spirosomataceae bacterium]
PFGGRTGSEMMLWYYLKFLKTTPTETIVYARRKGELVNEKSPANFTYHSNKKDSFLYGVYEGVYNKIMGQIPDITQLKRIHKKHQPDFWYINTIIMPEVSALAVRLGVPYVLHVHESITIYNDLRAEEAEVMFGNAAKIICCSEASRKYLTRMGYDAEVSYSFIDKELINVTQSPTDLRKQLGIPLGAFVWVMSGTMSVRKGYDLIPEILEKLPKNAFIVWLGRKNPSGIWHYIERSVAHNNLNFIHVPSLSEEYYDFLNIADGFVLLSREEPLGLVLVEAAFLQKPIVGFNVGGIEEIMQEGMGALIEGMNVIELVDKMKAIQDGSLLFDKEKLRSRALEFDKENQIQNWYETLQQL